MEKDCTIIITSASNKKYILKKLSEEKKLCNLKFFSFAELKKKLFFDYDVKTLEYVMKEYNVSLDVARTFLDNLYFIKDVNDSKVDFLLALKEKLDSNGYLIYDSDFLNYIKNKRLVVYGYSNFTKEQKIILDKLGNVQFINDEKEKYKPKVFRLPNLNEEVEFVVNRISKLYLDGVSLNKIKLIVKDDYINTLRYFLSNYHIPCNFKDKHAFYSTNLAQDFLRHYDDLDLNSNVERLKDKYDNINDLVTILNKSVMVQDKDLRKEFITLDFKKNTVKEIKYEEALEILTLDDYFDSSYYVFLLGFHIGSYPTVYKDEAYLSDAVLNKLGLDTSSDKNNYARNAAMEKITSIKNLVITCQVSDEKTIFPSILLDDLNLNVVDTVNDELTSYSKLNAKLKYASLLDQLYKFNILDKNLPIYQHNLKIDYLGFDNNFSGISNETLIKRINGELILSYTSMEMYNKCAFMYYVSNILNVVDFEDNFKAKLGTIAHHILEIGIERDINIPVEIMKFVKEEGLDLSSKEYFYLEKLGKELAFIIDVIKKQNENSLLKHNLFESSLAVYFDKDDVNITFKGKIDKVMFYKDDEKEVIAVVDYKTGKADPTLDNIKYGLNIQLPIYLYLLRKADRFKDAIVAGFYIQQILSNTPNVNDKKTLEEIKEENLRLQGFSNSSTSVLEYLDRNYLDSKMVKDLRFKNDGTFHSNAKVLDNKKMDEITEEVHVQILKVIDKILNGEFKVNPKIVKGKNVACEYCTFKDICYRKKQNEVVLGGDADGLD